jgi:alpha-D-xyloside xylohydrolase
MYNKTVYNVLVKKKGKEEAVLFARSATAGGQKFPVHWGGDCWSDYVSMEESLRGGLSLTMSGFGFWSHDIGGFEDKSTADVYKRWCAFGLLSTHSRLHGSSSYRVPWTYDEESVDVLRRFVKLKASLMPYLYRNAVETSITGVPMLRSMVLEFNDDRTCCYLDKQYMLGDTLLVSPVFNDKGIAEYYLPEGRWTNYLTGEEREGGKWFKEYHDYMSIPLYARPNSIVAVGAVDTDCEYDYAADALYKVYALDDGATASTVIYDGTANKDGSVTVTRNGDSYTIKADINKPCRVQLVNVKDSITVEFEKSGEVTV